MEEADGYEGLEMLTRCPQSRFLAEDISQGALAVLIQKVTLAALQILVCQVRHDVQTFIVGTPRVTVALGHCEIPLLDIVDRPHQDRRVPQRGLDKRVRQGRDPPQPLALPMQVHEKDAALELVPPRLAPIPLVLQRAKFLLVLVCLSFPLRTVVRVVGMVVAMVMVMVMVMAMVMVMILVMRVVAVVSMRSMVCANHCHKSSQYGQRFYQCPHLQ